MLVITSCLKNREHEETKYFIGFKMSVVYNFYTQIKKCNNDVKRHDNFTKLVLFTIGVML